MVCSQPPTCGGPGQDATGRNRPPRDAPLWAVRGVCQNRDTVESQGAGPPNLTVDGARTGWPRPRGRAVVLATAAGTPGPCRRPGARGAGPQIVVGAAGWGGAPVPGQHALTPLALGDGPLSSRWRATLIGAGAGAAVGAAVFLVQSDGCWREAESMCGLAVPLYVGRGAVAGGLFGHLIGGRAR